VCGLPSATRTMILDKNTVAEFVIFPCCVDHGPNSTYICCTVVLAAYENKKKQWMDSKRKIVTTVCFKKIISA